VADETFNELTGELAEPFDAERAPTWRIDSLGALDWALAKLAGIEREQDENGKLAEAAIFRVRAWLIKENSKLIASEAFFRGHVAAYANEHRAELLGDGKKKTRELPNGKLSWRRSGGGLKVVDEEMAIAWCRSEGLQKFVIQTPTLDLPGLRHWVSGGGVAPPGTERVPESDNLTITATGNELTTKRSNGNE
jgi:phage host-nuclease inhibitor protein Gam